MAGGDVSVIDSYLGDRLRRCRKSRRMSQTVLGQAVEVSYQQIQKYEDGTDRISASRLFQLSLALGVAVSHFYNGLAEHLANLAGFAETDQVAYAMPDEINQGKALNDAFKASTQPEKRKIVLDLAIALAADASGDGS